MRMKIIIVFLLFISLFQISKGVSQEIIPRQTSITSAVGFGINEGETELGMSFFYSIGWQKSVGENNRLRINPNLLSGGFVPFAISDVPDQYYRMTQLRFNVHYDLIKYKSFSLVTSAGAFVSLSRGLIGSGGRSSNNSGYFYNFYFGGNVSLGLRYSPQKNRIAYELRPSISLGNKGFIFGGYMLCLDFKIN